MEEWDRVAKICYHIPRFSKQMVKPDDFNPLRAKKNAADFGQVMAWAEDQKLAKYTSEDEIEARWEEFMRERNGR